MRRTMLAPVSLRWALAIVALVACPSAAVALPCAGVSVGTSDTGDVTLGGADSDACIISMVNPQQGPNGNPSGFEGQALFGTGWTLLAKVTSDPVQGTAGGVTFTIGLPNPSGTSGDWSVTSNQTGVIDLGFAMHASNHSAAFLFDNEPFSANATKNGTWDINWLNNGGQIPNFSNLTIFYRDPNLAVPLPSTLSLLLAAGFAGSVLRKRRAQIRGNARQ